MTDEALGWYAVRCVFSCGWPPEAVDRTYEERITLWRATSAEEAIERAEAEAREYAAEITEHPDAYLGLAQSYWMFGEPEDGAEVFSLMRNSELPPTAYLNQHFDTGQERHKALIEDGKP